MGKITLDLIRRKSEHNEGTMPELEEITLHQLEIEKIEIIGDVCRKLRILYLQNNIISKIENLTHLKDLNYLNLALNNITRIEGLHTCEFLAKLDLTVNFVDVDELRVSIHNLKRNTELKELFLVGNPSADWEGYRDYVIAELPQLLKLDGKDISKSERIRASQRHSVLIKELENLEREKKAEKQQNNEPVIVDLEDPSAPYTPELRTEMYREMAEEKEEKEKREKERLPKERDYSKEHEEAVERAYSDKFFKDGRVKQCNEGNLVFRLDEDKDYFYLYVDIPRFMDTSLLDCDIHPQYVTVVAKDKILRLATPEEVMADESKCERSTVTGELKVYMKKLKDTHVLIEKQKMKTNSRTKTRKAKPTKMERLMAVDIKTIYKGKENPNLSNHLDDLKIVEEVRVDSAKNLAEIEANAGVPPLE